MLVRHLPNKLDSLQWSDIADLVWPPGTCTVSTDHLNRLSFTAKCLKSCDSHYPSVCFHITGWIIYIQTPTTAKVSAVIVKYVSSLFKSCYKCTPLIFTAKCSMNLYNEPWGNVWILMFLSGIQSKTCAAEEFLYSIYQTTATMIRGLPHPRENKAGSQAYCHCKSDRTGTITILHLQITWCASLGYTKRSKVSWWHSCDVNCPVESWK